MKKIILLFILVFGMSYWGWGQISITSIGTAFTENFDGIGTSSTASLPSGWKVDQGTVYSSGTTATTQAYGTTGAGIVTGTSAGGTVNWANGVTGSSTERAVGFLCSGSYTSPRNLFVQIINNTGATINSLSITFDIEKYRSGSRAWNINFYSGTDGTNWIAQIFGDQAYLADANNITVFNPPTTISKSITISGLSIANGSSYYLRWAYTGSGGSTNAQGLGLDNFSITASSSGITAITVDPALLINFTYISGSGPSTSQSYNLGGTNLTPIAGNITVTAPTDYEVSSDNTNFYGSLLIPYTGGTLTSTTINVRLKAGLSANYYNNENVTNAGGGAITMNVTCSGMVLPGSPVIYSWTGADLGDWTVASNWSPARTIAFPNDILQFDDNRVKTVTNVPAQTLCQINVSNNTAITFQAAAGVTLTLEGGIGTDLVVGAGSQLNLGGTSPITMVLPAGVTGNISGSITFSGSAHRLMGTDNGSFTFASGSIFTAGTGFTGNAFGTTALNSVIFQSGSTYIHIGGANPFGASQPNSVVIFQPGSLYKLTADQTPSFSGRTYSNFELDYPSGTISVTGASSVILDNLIITNGTLNFNMTSTPGHSIKGNITVANGQTLAFNPTAAGTINLNGTSVQTIGGTGTITSGTNSTIVINSSNGVVLNNNFNHSGSVTVNSALICDGTSVISGAGTFTLASGATLKTGNTSGLDGSIAVSGTKTFDPAANYEFNGTSAQVTGTLLPATVNNLTIDNAAGVNLSNTTLTVSGDLTINSGKLFSVDSDKQVTIMGKALLK